MKPDASPPRAGEKTGVQSPAQKTDLPPTGTTPVPAADPYAGLSAIDLSNLLMKKSNTEREAADRARYIRALEGNPDPPDPLAGLSAIAKRLREKIGENPGNDEMALATDIAALRALFTDLLHNMDKKDVDIQFGLTVALRAQKQALDAFVALRKLEVLESKQCPPGWLIRK